MLRFLCTCTVVDDAKSSTWNSTQKMVQNYMIFDPPVIHKKYMYYVPCPNFLIAPPLHSHHVPLHHIMPAAIPSRRNVIKVLTRVFKGGPFYDQLLILKGTQVAWVAWNLVYSSSQPLCINPGFQHFWSNPCHIQAYYITATRLYWQKFASLAINEALLEPGKTL